MKANEAPKKIYVKITHPISDEYTEMIAFEDGDGIEYTRTDAFIEKACEWIGNNFHKYAHNALGKEYLANDFKTYMKGE